MTQLFLLTGKPSPSIIWLRNGILMDDNGELNATSLPETMARRMTESVVGAALRLTNLRRKDLMTDVTCQASNTNLTEPKSSTIFIDIHRTSNLPISLCRFH